MHALTARQTRLLERLRADGGDITTGRIHTLNRELGAPKRTTARRDIADLHRRGLLAPGRREGAYHLTRKATS
ncbi:hypothetical protein ACFYO9_37660 [Streptomyces sp. NPDC005863]|uniref:hypothetical protein n=1 Tax=Streptomyces sp. NPDC005863 TaxID=3364735 RepID=UPI0036B9603D